jgi:hypothetical protein
MGRSANRAVVESKFSHGGRRARVGHYGAMRINVG